MALSNRHNFLRRRAIKSTLASIAIISIATISSPLKASQKKRPGMRDNAALAALVNTLRMMQRDVCDTAANDLETSLENGSDLFLHLRNAGLDSSNVLELAEALKSLSSGTEQSLLSFSVSHNPKIGDSGVTKLAQSLPQTLQEIGFVDCNIRDAGGKAILEWANRAPNLKMICIERNKLKKETRYQFQVFSQSNPEITVIF